MRDRHEKFMRRAIRLAEKARGKTFPNPLVGAVIVKDGKVIGEGYHRKKGAPHAETVALKNARKILGINKIIGLSTHSVEEAIEAERQGADYIAIGPIFPTTTKPDSTPLKTEIIAKIKDRVKTPFVAVGGINLNNLEQVLTSGAQRVAVCRAIIEALDVSAATKEFKQRLYQV